MSTALYRRYRPETFSDVIGQEHVTEPLMTAISKNRVNHAYLFSGPRGCGKTTSARILARCLNCAKGPTPVPCGTCDSCVALARNGSGSLDVIEIDAASHGGVDDARDLRERATYAPVRDRYKIFIIDEAHMVTSAGFNALLKIVEEPPEHIKFIFATTEPDKVIGTIRSRTHHYPFRLVPPEPLMAYLELICRQENIPVAPGVLSLVVRAGGGSVRDSLSVLDQLMAGAGSSGLDYELAVSLLGYTHASLLDDVVDAIAAEDAATVFGAVDRVIQTGHDPRRFVEDLLERFRDLIIVNAVPDAAASILRGVPEDQLNRMRTQSQQLGRAELSRAADITNTALTEMTGATSPRLHLELLCARILLPAADQSEQGTLARVDRIERRLSYAGGLPETVTTTAPVPSSPPAAAHPQAPSRQPAGETAPPASPSDDGEPAAGTSRDEPAPAAKRERATEPAEEPGAADWGGGWGAPADSSAAARRPERPRPAPEPARLEPVAQQPPLQAAPQQTPHNAGQIEMIRRAWPEIMDELARIKRSTWLNVNTDAKPRSFSDNQLTLAFASQGNALGFQRGQHIDNLKQAINKVLGLTCAIEAIHDGAAAAGEPDPKVPPSRYQPADGAGPAGVVPSGATVEAAQPASSPVPASTEPVADEAWGLDPDDPGPREPSYEDEPAARPSRYQQLLGEAARSEAALPQRPSGAVDLNYVEDIPSAEDETIEESGLVGRQAIERILNGRLIEERSLEP